MVLGLKDDLRTIVARQMLRDELQKVPHRFDDAWAEEAEAWLGNADSAIAALLDRQYANLRAARTELSEVPDPPARVRDAIVRLDDVLRDLQGTPS
uniref:hypothetical protein n=1 Tax=uncultured Sphingomonas sp. TaxID=158754 RepID=UPI0035CB0BD3